METRKVVISETGIATITCPFCRETKMLSVDHYRESGKRILKVKCGCSKVFSICLESRQHQRKSTSLLGQSINLTNHMEKQDIIIRNISLGGMAFCPFKKHKTCKDDLLQVTFSLNDSRKTPIDTQVTVRTSTDDYIGCEFRAINRFETSLGFFLSPGSNKIE